MDLSDSCNCKVGYTYNPTTNDCDCDDGTYKDSDGLCQRIFLIIILLLNIL